MDTTGWWMVAAAILVLIFIGADIFFVTNWGVEATFSSKIANAARDHPIIAWFTGLVMGGLAVHFFE
jgi:threonine/homoserine/homoserine lactone efflux protein